MLKNYDPHHGFSDSVESYYEPYLIKLPRGISRLEKLGELISCHKNHVLVKAGQIPKYCYVVKSGRVVSYEYSANGKERIYNFNERNSMLLESNLLFNKLIPVNFRTTMPSKLIRIDRPTLLNAVSKDSQLALDIMESISMKFLSSMELIRQFNVHNTPWRICNFLLIFAAHYGVPYDGKILIREKISQQMIANMLGINRITVVRVIKDLKNMALIENINGYYCIRNVEQFKKHQKLLDNL